MSRDLLADLDSFYQPSKETKNVPQTTAQESHKPTSGHTDDFLDFGSWGEAPVAQTVIPSAFDDWTTPPASLLHDRSLQASNEDDFGDFESGEADETSSSTIHPVTESHDPWSNLAGIASTLPVPSSISQPIQSEQQQYFPRPLPLHEQKQPRKAKTVRKPLAPRDPSVFFDAEDDEETDEAEGGNEIDDDFGSFAMAGEETKVAAPQLVPPPPPPVSSKAVQKQFSLLDFDEGPVVGMTRGSAKDGGFGFAANSATTVSSPIQAETDFGWDAFESQTAPTSIETFGAISNASSRIVPTQSKKAIPRPRKQQITKTIPTNDDAWDDFDVAPVPTPTPNPIPKQNTTTTISTNHLTSPTTLPPSNIPPPSVLLSLFPYLLKTATTQLFAHLSDQSTSTSTSTTTTTTTATRTAILTHPTTTSFLHSYLTTLTVLARLLAGRKLRWKRDSHLSQNMRIGPSPSRGGGGMKLAGVDRAEVSKEDREVADVLRLWRAQVGKLRSAVSSANAGGAGLPAIPELAEKMVVRVVVGSVAAVRQCAVCALKRDERVAKVEEGVEDVFGEWWVEHWGHRSCVAFWRGHEGSLRSR